MSAYDSVKYKAWYKANREKKLAQVQEYNKRNPEKIREYKRHYRAERALEIAAWFRSPAGRRSMHKANTSEQGRARDARYRKTPKARARCHRYYQSPKGRANIARKTARRRERVIYL
jgi:hypothetical protein